MWCGLLESKENDERFLVPVFCDDGSPCLRQRGQRHALSFQNGVGLALHEATYQPLGNRSKDARRPRRDDCAHDLIATAPQGDVRPTLVTRRERVKMLFAHVGDHLLEIFTEASTTWKRSDETHETRAWRLDQGQLRLDVHRFAPAVEPLRLCRPVFCLVRIRPRLVGRFDEAIDVGWVHRGEIQEDLFAARRP